MWLHALTAWKSGLRGRTFHAVIVFALLTLFAAWLTAAFSARQPQAVAMDVGLSGIRIAMTFMVLIWVQELVAREIERRSVFFVLAYPQARIAYVFGRFVGILTLTWVALALLAGLLVAVIQISSWGYQYPHQLQLGLPYWLTIVGFAADLAVVAAMALAVATVSTSTVLPFVVGMAFAIGARMLGPVLQFLSTQSNSKDGLLIQSGAMLNWVKWIMPDLDRLDWRAWALYSLEPDISSIFYALLMAAAFSAIVLILGAWAFKRRQFQ